MSAEEQQTGPHQENEPGEQGGLNKNTSSTARGIGDALVLKEGDIAFVAQRNGSVPFSSGHGYGLYYHDCRFLNAYELRIEDDIAPEALRGLAPHGFDAIIELTNPQTTREDISKDQIGITWHKLVDADSLALFDQLLIHNFGVREASLGVTLGFAADFEDIFQVRGMARCPDGRLYPPVWQADDLLYFRYDGTDGIHRTLEVQFSPAPDRRDDSAAHFALKIQPRQETEVRLHLRMAESSQAPTPPSPRPFPDMDGIRQTLSRRMDEWCDEATQVESDSLLFNRIMHRSLSDLRMLLSRKDHLSYIAAGIPWFITLFGRDNLIASLQLLAFKPETTADSLRTLARYQGDDDDAWEDDQPGRIIHEMRVGEGAHTGAVPAEYYGSVDAPLLFLIAIARHAAWTGQTGLFHELASHVERALAWVAEYGDSDGDGYIEYEKRSSKGLRNQGWKDSGNGVVNSDGSLAEPPIALVEVQGYLYLARLEMADLFRRSGDGARADVLVRDAQRLRERFNRDYWMEDERFYVLALQGSDKRPARVISSNPGQALWTGIVDEDRAGRVVERLLAPDMFSGWGVRTLSSREPRYNPIGYHLGTVWPHDNSIIAAGFRRYGYDRAMRRILDGMVDAASYFPEERLPEVFAGFERGGFHVPVHYPVACHPQAWAAGTLPFLLHTALGLEADGFQRRLRIVRPMLPAYVNRLDMRNLRVGDVTVDLRFRRDGERAEVETVDTRGDLKVEVVPAG